MIENNATIRYMHHHVFDLALLKQCAAFAGLETVDARKRRHGLRDPGEEAQGWLKRRPSIDIGKRQRSTVLSRLDRAASPDRDTGLRPAPVTIAAEHLGAQSLRSTTAISVRLGIVAQAQIDSQVSRWLLGDRTSMINTNSGRCGRSPTASMSRPDQGRGRCRWRAGGAQLAPRFRRGKGARAAKMLPDQTGEICLNDRMRAGCWRHR